LVWGDIVHFSDLQIAEPDCGVIYDLDPNAACQARYRILRKAATENQLIAGAHVSGNGLCTITEHHNKFIPHTSFLA
jgi:hypothetical protein